MGVMLTGLLLAGFVAAEATFVAVNDQFVKYLVLPSFGDAVMAGPPLDHPDEPDYSALTEQDLLKMMR